MKQIYSEGRVVGLSQYELYVRQLLSTQPEATPLTEREWLATTLSANTSMILRVPEGTETGYHDFPLPENSQLCGCTVVYASVFQGQVTLDSTGYWATSVYDYGELISNTEDSHPVTPGFPVNVPVKFKAESLPPSLRAVCSSYSKIISGLVIQPGEWTETHYPEPLPYESLEPNFSNRPFVRIMIAEKLATDVLILLHGFTYYSNVMPTLNIFDPGKTSHPENGDFLGPETFPWSCPIVFLMTTDVQKTMMEELLDEMSLYYTAPLETDQGERIWTEDEQELDAERYGTIVQMWKETHDSN